jgi:hypothetical protein
MKKSLLARFTFIVALLSGWILSIAQGGEPQRCRCCQPPAGEKQTLLRMEQRSYSLLDQTLYDERIIVLAARADLIRWDRAARLRFRLWFGTDHPAARRYLFRTVSRIAVLSSRYRRENFAAANPSREGVVAYVHPDDPSHIFFDRAFLTRPVRVLDSRAGTLVHEMSHFDAVAGTKDHVYGTDKALRLARQDPVKALTNADNIEFYCEFVARQRFHFKQTAQRSAEEPTGGNVLQRCVQAKMAAGKPQ